MNNEKLLKEVSKIPQIESQMDNIEHKGYYILNKIKNGENITIDLIGDSISAGVGSAGYNLTSIPIFTDGSGTTYYEPNQTSLSWANRFRNYIKRVSPTSTFNNRAIGGKSSKFFNTEKDRYFNGRTLDIAFVMLGTNDRVVCSTIDEFKQNLTELLDYIDKRSNYMVVMSANPVLADYDAQGNFTQEQANNAIVEICKEKGYPLINHFRKFTEKMYLKNYVFTDVLSDNAHPNDKGYMLYWDNIQEDLGIKDTIENYSSVAEKNVILAKYKQFTNDTLPTDYPVGCLIYNYYITGADSVGFPEGKGGIMVVDTTTTKTSYYKRFYYIVNENKMYISTCKSNLQWAEWENISKYDIAINNIITNDTVLTDIPKKVNTVNTITTTTNLPMNRTGTMETCYPHLTSGSFAYQKFRPSNNNYEFSRSADTLGTNFNNWKQRTQNQKMQQFTPSVGTVNANSSVDVDLTIDGGMNDNFMHVVTVESNIASGVSWCGFKKDNNTYTLRFTNITGANVTVGSIICRYVTLEVISY